MKEQNLMMPEIGIIKEIIKETEQETRFRIAFESGRSLGFRPGQFIILSILGVGEAPFSITSDPNNKECFEICVRNVGAVSGSLHRKEAGDRIGIRGPYGTTFDKNEYFGKSVVFVAGGIGLVPLRSAILDCFKDRGRINGMTVLYGSKNIRDMVYSGIVKRWMAEEDVEVDIILDDAEGTRFKQGLITQLIEEREFESETQFVICGPPIMYRFVIGLLQKKGIHDDQIWISLERHMKCGVGKCGHCRIDDICVCQSGPVFRYDRVKDKWGVI